MSDLAKIDTYAKKWIKEASERIKASFTEELTIKTKSHANDLVTDIDQSTERFFIEKIKSVFPDHRILGEEGFGDDVQSLEGVVWIIDPIDGTMNFVHQQRNFAISIGIFEDGVGKIGLIYDVVHDELYHAVSGQGAYLNDMKIPSMRKTKLSQSILGLNATWVTENKRIDSNILAPLVKRSRGTRSYGSAALEIVYVATGRIDAYITLRLAPWDYAAGMVIIEELGGRATSLRGEKLNLLKGSSVFFANEELHDEVMRDYLHNGKW